MPLMDGYEFVRHLRLDGTTRTIPVVFYVTLDMVDRTDRTVQRLVTDGTAARRESGPATSSREYSAQSSPSGAYCEARIPVAIPPRSSFPRSIRTFTDF
jgi:CheY-like chemotaxis protein